MALTHNNLGLLFGNLGRRDKAVEEYRAALDVNEALVADFPGVAAHIVDLGRAYGNFGNLTRNGGDAASAVDWHARAIARLVVLVTTDPRNAEARVVLQYNHMGRALDFGELRQHAKALPDWDRALELDDGSNRDAFRIGRAACLARLGRNAEALAVTDELVAVQSSTAGMLYDCACVYALASAPEKAIATLRRASAAGFRNTPHMLRDADLDSLRRRDDYAALLWDMADVPAPVKP